MMISEQINALRSYLLVVPITLPIISEPSQYNFNHSGPDVDFQDAGD
jgi:hypothetical protein